MRKDTESNPVETERRNRSLVLFDVDNTLLQSFTIFPFTSFLKDKGLMSNETYDQVFADKKRYEDKELDYHQFAEDVVAHFYAGLANRTFTEISKAGKEFQEAYQTNLMPFTRELIEIMRNQGDLIVISGANIEAFLPLAENLGIPKENLYLLEGEIVDGKYTGRVKVNMAIEEEKKKIVQNLKASGFNPLNSFAFGDSTGDLPILEAVSNPFAVEPNPALAEIAAERGWKIVDRGDILQEVTSIISRLDSSN